MIKKKPVNCQWVLVFFLLMSDPLLSASLSSGQGASPLTLRWAAVDGAIGYVIQMVDETGAAVLEQKVSTNLLKFSLPPGNYRVRIGVINKFDKFWYWSDWEQIRVVKRTPFETVMHLVGVRLSAGPVFYRVAGPWDRYLENSFSGASLNLGLYSDYRFLRFFGIELEISGVYLQGKENLSLSNYMAGGGILAKTAFNFPLNGILRAGGGFAFTRLAYVDAFSAEEQLLWDSYPYYKVGAALEFRVYSDYFLEGGVNYTVTALSGRALRGFEGFLRIGTRLGVGISDEERGMLDRKEVAAEAPVAVRISLGYRTVLLLPEWNEYLKHSIAGGMFTLGFVGRHGFMRHLGLEYEAGAAFYNAKTGDNTMTQYSNGVNLLYHSGFVFPLNLVARLGAGMMVTGLRYKQPFLGEEGTAWTEDLFYKGSLAAEYRFRGGLFLEAGSDIIMVSYQSKPLRGVGGFVRLGVIL